MKKKVYYQLFLTFFKIGAFTFGGGYAMIPLIEKEICHKKHWMEEKDILDITAISESTPGSIAVNAATFVGNKVGGFFGALFATIGVVLPSFVIIYLISFILRQFEEFPAVQYAFIGVRACVLALIIQACASMYRQCEKTMFSFILMILSFLAVTVFDVSVLYVILVCAAAGIIYIFRKGENA